MITTVKTEEFEIDFEIKIRPRTYKKINFGCDCPICEALREELTQNSTIKEF